jgi:hypothetical protein
MSKTLQLTDNGVPYDWNLAGPDGASFILHPIKNEHTKEDVKEAEQQLRDSQDVVSMRVIWIENAAWHDDGQQVRRYATRRDLVNKERGLIAVNQTHGLGAVDGMDGLLIKRTFDKPLQIDAFTLGMLKQVYNAISEKNQARMDKFSWAGAIDFGWELIERCQGK